jgi:hypothetical protein
MPPSPEADDFFTALISVPRGDNGRIASRAMLQHLKALRPPIIAKQAEELCRTMSIIINHTTWGEGWQKWKTVSFSGYDLVQGHIVDYTNQSYVTFTELALAVPGMGDEVRALMAALQNNFETLGPDSDNTKHRLSMMGDVVEIYMAGLRAHHLFRDERVAGWRLQMRFAEFCSCMRTIDELNGSLYTGYVWYRREHVTPLASFFSSSCTGGRTSSLAIDSFAALWAGATHRERGSLLLQLGDLAERHFPSPKGIM